ncbi:MAG: hypothetical protein JNK64_32085 [Myxococcales bacterium]|nr:hypothetical protein [Myxococcales bacterium]
MSRAAVAAVALVAVVAPAGAAPATPVAATSEAWATGCAAAVDGAAARIGQRHRAFAGVRADVLPPIDRPATRSGRMWTPPVRRHGWGVGWSLQLAVPEYFYVDLIDVRDDRGGWQAVAQAAWACATTRRGSQRDTECVVRRGERLAVVRAIAWRRSTRVDAYLRELAVATEACLAAP